MKERKTVLITGGNAGIGLAIATEIARSGAQVVLARNQARAAKAREKILDVFSAATIKRYL
ncbi:MAG: SDR family NAD(P)-dependent oxidoreductase [Smithella sp.]